MKKLLLLTTVLLSACVSTKNIPLNVESLEKAKPNQITLTNREKPGFAATTAGKAVFGAIGVAGMVSAGNKIIAENNVEDPANFIGIELAKLLSEKYELPQPTKSGLTVKGFKSKEVIETYANAGLVVDMQTINWGFVYFPSQWGKYRVNYSAKLRLIDSDAKKLLAEGFCIRVPEYDESAPTKDELLANSAQRLKKELSIAAKHCIDELKSKVLQL